jgi:hypothetical protein
MKTTRNKVVSSSLFWLKLIGFSVLILATPRLVWALPTPGGWIDQRAELVSPEAAQLVIDQRELELAQQRDQQAQLLSQQAATSVPTALSSMALVSNVATQVPAATEFIQLATALENNPLRIYQFVRNHFTYVPYYGALKGPYLTLKERSGNDFDQAAVLVELLRAAGYTANFQYGSMSIPVSDINGQDMAHWLGSDADATIISTILANGGIPALNYTTSITLDRIWVVANINGVNVALDPAFKPNT